MPDLSPEGLAEMAAAAVGEAAASREKLGRARAAEFRAAPDKFDPSGLLVLGSSGLQAFAGEIGICDLVTQPTFTPTYQHHTPSSASGWSPQQNDIIPFERFGVVVGILSGLILICAISVQAWLNS